MQVELIETPEGLAQLEGPWRTLQERAPYHEIFATPAWVLAWFESVGRPTGRALAVAAVRDDGDLVGVFPLQRCRRLGLEVLEFAGFPRHADRMQIVLDEARGADVCRAFADWLGRRQGWDVLSLRCFGARSDQPEVLADALARSGLRSLLRPDAATYFVDLEPFAGVEDYLAEFRGGRTRKALRRQKRRLAEAQGGQWQAIRQLDEPLLREIADLDTRRSLRGTEQLAFLGDPRNLDFMRALVARMADREFWRITALETDGRILAYDVSFQHLGCRLSYQTAYDRSLVAFGAGNLALVEAIASAIDDGCREFDFLAGDEGYKENWCREARRLRWVLAFSGSARSRPAYAYHRWLKPLRSRLAGGRLGALIPRTLRDRLDV